jgi:hypothetical protein
MPREQSSCQRQAGESTLHPMYFLPKKKYKISIFLYYFWEKKFRVLFLDYMHMFFSNFDS